MPEGKMSCQPGFEDINQSCAGFSTFNQLPQNPMNQFSDQSVNGTIFGLQQSQVQSKNRQELECSFKIVSHILANTKQANGDDLQLGTKSVNKNTIEPVQTQIEVSEQSQIQINNDNIDDTKAISEMNNVETSNVDSMSNAGQNVSNQNSMMGGMNFDPNQLEMFKMFMAAQGMPM